MARAFRGESTHKVDQKGRVSVPASFRRVLEEGDPDWRENQNPNLVLLYGMPGPKRLEGYTINGVDDIDAAIAKLPRFSRTRAYLERMLSSKSVYVQVDDNGRIVLSAKLRELIGLNGDAVFVGMGERFQIWAPEDFTVDDIALSEEEFERDPLEVLDAIQFGTEP